MYFILQFNDSINLEPSVWRKSTQAVFCGQGCFTVRLHHFNQLFDNTDKMSKKRKSRLTLLLLMLIIFDTSNPLKR